MIIKYRRKHTRSLGSLPGVMLRGADVMYVVRGDAFCPSKRRGEIVAAVNHKAEGR